MGWILARELATGAGMRMRLRGFTLVELLVTVSVAAILLALAAPSMADLLRNNRLAAANNTLVGSLNVARAEALRRGRVITLCASTDQRTCSASNDWATGWVVFEDTVSSGTPVPPPAPPAAAYDARMISVGPAPGAGFSLQADDTWYRYSPMGTLSWSTAATASQRSFTLRNTACVGQQQRSITVNRIGRIHSATEACP